MTTKDAFLKFNEEGTLIGRLLAEYADIELSLFYCINAIRDDFDTTFKALFKSRGETRRIELADIFGRQKYHELGLGTKFEMAISSVRYCMKVRNQFAHCVWWDDHSGNLTFANLEEAALSNEEISNLDNLEIRHIDTQSLKKQEEYFEYTDELLLWLNYEGRRKMGKEAPHQKTAPKQLKQPKLFIEHK